MSLQRDKQKTQRPKMPRIQDIVVAENDEDFDKLLRRSALIAVFVTARDSERFSQKNDRLRQRIEDTFCESLGSENVEGIAYVNYDWWPDHTRHVEVNAAAFKQSFFDALCALLVDEFDEWRIQAVVYRDIMDGGTMIGAALIWSDKLIVDKALYDWMCQANFDIISSVQPRWFSLTRDDLETPRRNLMDDPG